MIALSLQIEGQQGLNWPRWKKLVAAAEEAGFATLYRSDHLTPPAPPDLDALEAMVSLTYVATHTQRIQFGPLVAPISFRDPVQLARQAAAIDDLSSGRFILGLGGGWQEREHAKFGYQLGDPATRMDRMEEGVEVITKLLHSNEPVSFNGRYFQLHDALLLPRPQRPGGPRILIGGNGPKRTLPMVARYADIWNAAFLSIDAFRERSALLDSLLAKEGRQPQSVRRTLFAQDSLTDEPQAVIEHIRAYEQAGVEELVLWWHNFDDADGLRRAGERIIPQLG